MTEQDPIRRRAEDILKRYDEEEFDIEWTLASLATTTEAIKLSREKEDKQGYGPPKNLILTFTNSLSDFRQSQKSQVPREIDRASIRLVNAYDLLRSSECIKDGRATKRRLTEKDKAISDLQGRLEEAAKKLGVAEEHLRDCSDEKIELENTIKEQKEKLDNIRAQDIKDSLSSEDEPT